MKNNNYSAGNSAVADTITVVRRAAPGDHPYCLAGVATSDPNFEVLYAATLAVLRERFDRLPSAGQWMTAAEARRWAVRAGCGNPAWAWTGPGDALGIHISENYGAPGTWVEVPGFAFEEAP